MVKSIYSNATLLDTVPTNDGNTDRVPGSKHTPVNTHTLNPVLHFKERALNLHSQGWGWILAHTLPNLGTSEPQLPQLKKMGVTPVHPARRIVKWTTPGSPEPCVSPYIRGETGTVSRSEERPGSHTRSLPLFLSCQTHATKSRGFLLHGATMTSCPT